MWLSHHFVYQIIWNILITYHKHYWRRSPCIVLWSLTSRLPKFVGSLYKCWIEMTAVSIMTSPHGVLTVSNTMSNITVGFSYDANRVTDIDRWSEWAEGRKSSNGKDRHKRTVVISDDSDNTQAIGMDKETDWRLQETGTTDWLW